MSFSMSRDEFAAYLDSVRITGEVATPRENNLDHIQGFLDGNEHLEFGVQWTREWDYDSVFEVMVRRAGLNPDRSHTHGQVRPYLRRGGACRFPHPVCDRSPGGPVPHLRGNGCSGEGCGC